VQLPFRILESTWVCSWPGNEIKCLQSQTESWIGGKREIMQKLPYLSEINAWIFKDIFKTRMKSLENGFTLKIMSHQQVSLVVWYHTNSKRCEVWLLNTASQLCVVKAWYQSRLWPGEPLGTQRCLQVTQNLFRFPAIGSLMTSWISTRCDVITGNPQFQARLASHWACIYPLEGLQLHNPQNDNGVSLRCCNITHGTSDST